MYFICADAHLLSRYSVKGWKPEVLPLVAGIRPAVERTIAEHPEAEGDNVVPLATEENLWQAIENLFLESPRAREMVQDGAVRVAPAVYDVGSGKVTWLDEKKVHAILEAAENSPRRAIDPLGE